LAVVGLDEPDHIFPAYLDGPNHGRFFDVPSGSIVTVIGSPDLDDPLVLFNDMLGWMWVGCLVRLDEALVSEQVMP